MLLSEFNRVHVVRWTIDNPPRSPIEGMSTAFRELLRFRAYTLLLINEWQVQERLLGQLSCYLAVCRVLHAAQDFDHTGKSRAEDRSFLGLGAKQGCPGHPFGFEGFLVSYKCFR